jgi:hypothetical protein
MIRPEDQIRWRPWLLAGERLLWAGRPKRGLILRWADLYVVPLSLLWGGLMLVEWGRLLEDPAFSDAVVAVPVALLTLYLVPGRFLIDAFLRARIHYAVTSRRILILRGGPFASLSSVELDYLPMLDLKERAARGTIVFDPGEERSTWRGEGLGHLIPALRKETRFYRIEQPRLVYDLIQKEAARRRRETLGELPPHRAFIG